MTDLKDLLSRLKRPHKGGDGWTACCPSHDDKHSSLSIAQKEGKILLHCFAGCQPNGVVAAIGLTMADLFLDSPKPAKKDKDGGGRREVTAIYQYNDAAGNPLARKLRYQPKAFSWQRWHGGNWVNGLGAVKTPLYRFDEIVKACGKRGSIIIVEGEKDADAGLALGYPVSTSGGVGSWRSDHAEILRGWDITIIADNDEPGIKHAQAVARSLQKLAKSIRFKILPGEGKDLTDFLELHRDEKGQTIRDINADTLLKSLEKAGMDPLTAIERYGHEAFCLQGNWSLLEELDTAETWKPCSIEVATLLDRIMHHVRRFVVMTEGQARIVSLWVIHTHCLEASDTTPYLSVSSPEKQSGKSLLLEVLQMLVHEPWLTGRVTAAVLPRKIEAKRPTLLLDETDAAFGSDPVYAETLRGVLNNGFQRSGVYSCCVGQGANITYKDFSTFCPKVLAGIGALPDTIGDRSIPIRLQRAMKTERQDRFVRRVVMPLAEPLRKDIATWAEAHVSDLLQVLPKCPVELTPRQEDVSWPLLAIADLAGGEWSEKAGLVLCHLYAGGARDNESIGSMLLADLHGLFFPRDNDGVELPALDRISSADLVRGLAEMEERPWPEWGISHKPISPPQVARQLQRYGIGPRTIKFPGGHAAKGYHREQFEETWQRYAPSSLWRGN